MEEAARIRVAACEAVDDITPTRLRGVIQARLEDATVTPGVLTLLSARATDRTADAEALDRRAAGVQLIYRGLELTRSLARSPPWADADADIEEADVAILAADVLVARGFHLLADTEAAPKAVETVRAFGRDETDRAADRTIPEHALEADVFELAIIAGVSATGDDPPAEARSFATGLAKSFDRELPQSSELLSDRATRALSELLSGHDRPTASSDRIWAGSSVTDT